MAAVLAVPVMVAATPAMSAVRAGSAEPAQSATARGISVCLGLWASDGKVKLEHSGRCGPNGTYHIRIWGGGRADNGDDYRYYGVIRYFGARWPVPKGTNICAELWFHKPGGGYSSWGLPCDRM